MQVAPSVYWFVPRRRLVEKRKKVAQEPLCLVCEGRDAVAPRTLFRLRILCRGVITGRDQNGSIKTILFFSMGIFFPTRYFAHGGAPQWHQGHDRRRGDEGRGQDLVARIDPQEEGVDLATRLPLWSPSRAPVTREIRRHDNGTGGRRAHGSWRQTADACRTNVSPRSAQSIGRQSAGSNSTDGTTRRRSYTDRPQRPTLLKHSLIQKEKCILRFHRMKHSYTHATATP